MNYRIALANDGYASTENTEDGPVERWNEFATITATSDIGRRFALDRGSYPVRNQADEDRAREACALVDHNPDTNPEAWVEIDPVYGSEAWGSEAEYELACFEADCFDEPRPRW